MHKVSSIECALATSSVQTHRICSNRRPQCAMATCHRFKTIQTIFGRLQCCLEALDFKGFSLSNKLYNWKQTVNSNGRDKTLNNQVFCCSPKMIPEAKYLKKCQVFQVDVYTEEFSLKRVLHVQMDHPSLFGDRGQGHLESNERPGGVQRDGATRRGHATATGR